jgi:valyl-tRNA synthetase
VLVRLRQEVQALPRRLSAARIDAMADQQEEPLEEQLRRIGAQLDWVRDYL